MSFLKLPKHYHPDFAIPNKKPVGMVEKDSSESIANNLELFATLSERSGGRAFDSAGHTTLTKSGVIYWDNIEGIWANGNRLSNGNTSDVFTASKKHLPSTDDWTVFLKLNKQSLGLSENAEVFAQYSGGQSGRFYCRISPSETVQIFDGSSTQTITGVAIPETGWFTLCMTRKGNTFSVYINGFFEGSVSSSVSIYQGVNTTFLGSSLGSKFRGYCANISVYSRALNVSEVLRLDRDNYTPLRPITPPVYFAPSAAGGTPITPQSLAASSSLTSPALTQHNALAVDDLAVSTTLTGVTLTTTGEILPDSLSSASSISSPEFTQHNNLSADSLAVGSSLTSSAFTEHSALSIDSLASDTALTSPTLVQQNILVVDDLVSATSLTEPAFAQHNALSVDSLASATTLTEPALSVAGALSVASLVVSSSLSEAGLTQHNILIVDDLAVSSSLSSASLAGTISLSVNDLAVGASVSQSTLDVAFAILADNLSVSSSLSEPALDQHNVLVVGDLDVNTLLSVVSFGGAVISCLSGYITIQPKLSANTTIKPALSGNIKIH